MKYFIILLFILITTTTCNNKTLILSNEQYGFIEFDEFAVRKKPILNREYLIFLSWYIDTYGFSYPEKVLQILPKNSVDSNLILTENYNHLTDTSLGVLSQYIFNPKYLNYPLVGLNSNQIMEMQKWLSDRYNENRLIDIGVFNFNSAQIDEDCFVTESYLVGQYQGDLQQNKSINWSDKEFLPTFRLPFKKELVKIKNKNEALGKMRPYRFTNKDFLWRWDKRFISTNLDENELTLNLHAPLKFKVKSTYELDEFVDSYTIQETKQYILKNASVLQLEQLEQTDELAEYPFKEKGKYGQMDFVIIGNNESGQPLVLTNNFIKKLKKESSLNKVSMMVYSKILN